MLQRLRFISRFDSKSHQFAAIHVAEKSSHMLPDKVTKLVLSFIATWKKNCYNCLVEFNKVK